MKRMIVPVISILLIGLSCRSTAEIPVLPADCSGHTFHLRGEITSVWKTQVQPEIPYEVIIRDEDALSHGIHWIQIFVSDEKGNYFGPETGYTDAEATLSFSSSEEDVLIHVSSSIGEGNKDYGEFSITLCEVDS